MNVLRKRNSKNKCFSPNFDQKSSFFQTAISYSQNLQGQTNFISIDCKMFVDYEYNNKILLNIKYRRKRVMSWLSSVLFFLCPDRCPERCPDRRPCLCPDRLCTLLVPVPVSIAVPAPVLIKLCTPLSLSLSRSLSRSTILHCPCPCPDRLCTQLKSCECESVCYMFSIFCNLKFLQFASCSCRLASFSFSFA